MWHLQGRKQPWALYFYNAFTIFSNLNDDLGLTIVRPEGAGLFTVNIPMMVVSIALIIAGMIGIALLTAQITQGSMNMDEERFDRLVDEFRSLAIRATTPPVPGEPSLDPHRALNIVIGRNPWRHRPGPGPTPGVPLDQHLRIRVHPGQHHQPSHRPWRPPRRPGAVLCRLQPGEGPGNHPLGRQSRYLVRAPVRSPSFADQSGFQAGLAELFRGPARPHPGSQEDGRVKSRKSNTCVVAAKASNRYFPHPLHPLPQGEGKNEMSWVRQGR